jgi:hypothetical protein
MSEKIDTKYAREFEQEKDRFTQFIAESLRDNHYIQFIPPVAEIKATWRETAPCTPENMDFIIRKSRVFIMTISNTDTKFLLPMAQWMARYLAHFAKRTPKYDGDYCTARHDLIDCLYTDFRYIQNLLKQKEEKRSKRPRISQNSNTRKQIAERMGPGIAYCATSDGRGFVPTKNKKGKQIVIPDYVRYQQTVHSK